MFISGRLILVTIVVLVLVLVLLLVLIYFSCFNKENLELTDKKIPNKKIVVIGNGKSMLNYNFGDILDNDKSFIIYRLNHHHHPEHQKKMGIRTDVRVLGGDSWITSRHKWNEKTLSNHPDHRHSNARTVRKLKLLNAPMISQSWKKYNFKKVPTIGLATITHLVETTNLPIFIHGFDCNWIPLDGKSYPNRGLDNGSPRHALINEKEIVDKLISDGKIRRLSDILS